ncbi:hypothetical protein FRX31_009442 [Thalictrum thalictroides]|uniref:Uncharacterized protein n=1 Tax=Thalictrum thalictroides TaxID=46969 RepID=A0A7J6WWC2_THATH|nr:hypothetical protein FRX31_009442 [Thalictrum thalictroides]
MKTTVLLVACFILFSLLLKIQGIRLEPGLKKPDQQQRVVDHEEKKERLIEVEETGVEEHILCKDGHCSGRSTRKLITKTPSTTTTSKNVKSEGTKVDPKMNHQPTDHAHGHGGNEENFSVKSSSSPKSEHGEATTGQYPDIIDIAGMDYSPARRKPPIHN